jgi:hypothetical protein
MQASRSIAVAILLSCATTHPIEDGGGGGGDSIRWKTFQLLVAGDLEGAGEYYLLATGASQLPRWLVAFQAAFSAANRMAGACQRVADDIFEGFKQLGQSPTLVRFTTGNSEGAAGIIGFDLGDGKVQQISMNGFHVAVRCGDRIYDAFTGPTGMRIAEYMAHLIPGMQRFPITMQ